MKYFQILFLLTWFILLVGCGEEQADLDSPKSYRSGNISFNYPKNWKISEDSDDYDVLSVIVETPGDAIVILQSFPADEPETVREYAEAFSSNAASEMSIGKVSNSEFEELPESNGCTWIREEFSIDLLSESVAHQRIFGTRVYADKQLVLIFQAVTADISKVKSGFDLIADTLKIEEVEP